MNALAIDDLLSTTLYSWYTDVSQWVPGSPESLRPCGECHWELAAIITVGDWPHELVDALVAAIDGVVRHVAESFQEGGVGADAATAQAREVVMGELVDHTDDIRDVLEQCIPYRLKAFAELELDLARLGAL